MNISVIALALGLGAMMTGPVCGQSVSTPLGSDLKGGPSPSTRSLSFKELDQDHDGRISKDEAQADVRLASAFSAIDKQGHGYISERQFDRWRSLRGRSGPGLNSMSTPSNSTAGSKGP